MMDLNRIRDLMIQVQDAGVTYIHFDYTLQYGQPKFNVYTPETSHNAFVSYDECIGHLEKLASKGEKGVAHQLAAKKLNELLAEKSRITKEIRDLHQHMEHVAALPARDA